MKTSCVQGIHEKNKFRRKTFLIPLLCLILVIEMVGYEIPGRKRDIIRFLIAVDRDFFALRLLKENNTEYYPASEAMRIIAEALDEPYSTDVLRVFAFPYFDKKQMGMMWIRITKIDDYTLLVERYFSWELEKMRASEARNEHKIQLTAQQ